MKSTTNPAKSNPQNLNRTLKESRRYADVLSCGCYESVASSLEKDGVGQDVYLPRSEFQTMFGTSTESEHRWRTAGLIDCDGERVYLKASEIPTVKFSLGSASYVNTVAFRVHDLAAFFAMTNRLDHLASLVYSLPTLVNARRREIAAEKMFLLS